MYKFYLIIISSGIFLWLFSGCAGHSEAILLYNGKLDVDLDGKSEILGRVVENTANEPIVSAYIIIDSTYLGTETDYNGNYKVQGIPPGEYNIKASAAGFEDITFFNFKIESGQRYLIDFSLQEVRIGPLIDERSKIGL